MSKHKETEEPQIAENEAVENFANGEANSENAWTKLQADLEQAKDLELRTRADFDNFRKRAQREKEDAIKFANGDLLEKLIPIIDSFDLGLSAARESGEHSQILVGMEMVSKQLQDFLKSQGVEIIDSVGQPFDHHLHEALGQEASDEIPEGHVVRQLRKGYKLRQRLIRPANVFVSKGSEEGAQA